MLREMREHDKEDKLEQKKSLREKKLQKKLKLKRKRQEEKEVESEEDSGSESDRDLDIARKGKKRYFNSDDEGDDTVKDGDVLAQQEALALKLLSKMHS